MMDEKLVTSHQVCNILIGDNIVTSHHAVYPRQDDYRKRQQLITGRNSNQLPWQNKSDKQIQGDDGDG
jgi:hypothetical protein